MRILGIETSCDETAVCLIDAQGDFGSTFHFQVLGNSLISQIAIHAQYGGVFPNLAKREHSRNLVPLLERVLEQGFGNQKAKIKNQNVIQELKMDELKTILAREPELYEQLAVFFQKCAKPEIDAVAVTVGPGLEPALWVGINFARALALAWNIPIVAVNHMEGHLIMSLMNIESGRMHEFEFPLLALLISGGHTELVLSEKWHGYTILGATRDDAVGEAFDKVARLLGLPYPGGAELSRLARDARSRNQKTAFTLPRPMLHDKTLDFSFAGLKTAVLKIAEAHSPLSDDTKSGIAREFEDAVTDVLVGKTIQAVDEYGVQTVVVGGGVSANSYIHSRLAEALEGAGLPRPLVPSPELATDNALMIALAGYFRAARKEFADPDALRANGNLKLV